MGGHSRLYLCTDKKYNKEYAVKKVRTTNPEIELAVF